MPDKFGLDINVTSINFGIFGFILVVMMLLRPEGFFPRTAAARSSCTKPRSTTRRLERRSPRYEPRPATSANVLEATGLTEALRRPVAVNDVDFTIPDAASCAHRAERRRQDDVLQLLTGLYKPTTGQSCFDGKDITAKLAAHRSRSAGIARTFQNIRLFGR